MSDPSNIPPFGTPCERPMKLKGRKQHGYQKMRTATCPNMAVVTINGRHYCKSHAPKHAELLAQR